MPAVLSWSSVAFGNGSFVAVASGSTTAATSTDGITWTSRTMPSAVSWSEVIYGGMPGVQNFVAVAYTTTTAATIAYSVAQTTFTIPVISPITGTTAYVKAT